MDSLTPPRAEEGFPASPQVAGAGADLGLGQLSQRLVVNRQRSFRRPC